VQLTFEGKERFEYVDDPIHKDLSAATRHDKSLFLCCDETARVDRLTSVADRAYVEHAHFNLGDLVDLPDGPDGELDIEGLDVDGDWLWIVGSHSLKRDKPESDESPRKALERVTRIKRDPIAPSSRASR
jgi:hypothetical protein